MLILDQVSGQLIESDKVTFVEKLLDLRKKEGPWEVIELIIKYWSESDPVRYKSFVIDVKDKRETRANKFGSNKSGAVRSTLDIPEDVIRMIRAVYKPEDLVMDKKFFNEMWKRFPVFRVAENL